MAKNKLAGPALSAVMKATTICLIALLVGLTVLAKVVEMEWLTEDSAGYGIALLMIASSYLGSAVITVGKEPNKLLVCVITGLAYYISLMIITMVFFDGKYNGIGVTALLILCGTVLPMFTKGRRHGVKTSTRKKVSNW